MPAGNSTVRDDDPLRFIEQRVVDMQAEIHRLKGYAVMTDNALMRQGLSALLLDTATIRGQLSAARCERAGLRVRAEMRDV